ncbi:MAG TPA: acetylxylan esterase, partial [Phycisphaerae bacterium]|nr:acetylxylan esterase [Phycisphaerae bacterium]
MHPLRAAYRSAFALSFALLLFGLAWGADTPKVPQSVTELWADFDPRAEPLEVEVAAEWADDAGVYQVLRYTIGTFKGAKARMAAFYGRPKAEGKVPGLLHMHGGGQRAFLDAVEYYVGRGYACISVNWGGRPMDEKHPEWPNTDWGAVDPTQSNVPGYGGLKPTPKSLVSFPSPKNNNWYLLTLACRRALTFLERRPEVDGRRLGIFGHSMGGNLTFYVAGTDPRVKAAVPSVGGVGFRTHDVPGIPGTARKTDGSDAATDLFRKTIASEAYAPHLRCPILFLGATNDFNSRMESVYRCYGLLRHREYRFTFAPHLNHRFLDENEVCRPLWLDAHLKGGFEFPKTPVAEIVLDRPDGVPRVRVTPDRAMRVGAVDIYYAIDPDALARFWRDAGARHEGDAWLGECPVMDLDRPLVAFANVHYDLDRP